MKNVILTDIAELVLQHKSFDYNENEAHEILKAAENSKSSVMAMGIKLRNAHAVLGKYMARQLIKSNFHKYDTALLILMRAGLPLGMGILDELEYLKNEIPCIFIHNDQISDRDIKIIGSKHIIIVDGVINSGNSIKYVISQLPSNRISLVTSVIPECSELDIENIQLFSGRTSKNMYKGEKIMAIQNGLGPDTGDRLFNTLLI